MAMANPNPNLNPATNDPDPDPGQEVSVDDVLRSLCSHLMGERHRGVLNLKKLIDSWDTATSTAPNGQARENGLQDRQRLEERILQILEQTELPEDETVKLWEMQHGCLLACSLLLSGSLDAYKGNSALLEKLQTISMSLLTHDEMDVQLAAGSVLGCVGKHLGPSVYLASRNLLFDLITKNLSRCSISSPEDELKSVEQGFDIHISSNVIREKIFVEATGFSKVEPSLKCLQALIENLDKNFVNCVDLRLVDLIRSCFVHSNRNIRECGFEICTAMLQAAPLDLIEYAPSLAEHLARGMSDNWSHVRHAAATGTRTFFLAYSENQEDFFPVLLPKLTLARYYRSGGNRLYAQESWRLIVGSNGCSFVSKYIDNVVNSYLTSVSSENLSEREAACSSILELAAKMERDKVLPHVASLLEALIKCCQDENWTVRDSASLAVGGFVQYFPQESQPYLTALYPALFKNLEDPVQLLRQGAASALAAIAKAYGSDALSIILEKVIPGLAAVEGMNSFSSTDANCHCQPETTTTDPPAQHQHKHFDSPIPKKIEVTSASLFKALRPQHSHSPATSGASSHASCAICEDARISKPWHLSDGCMFLIGTLAEQEASQTELPSLIPLMVKSTQTRCYEEHYQLLVTLCRVIPLLAKAIGKRPFKEFLDILFEPIFYTAQTRNPQISAAGRDCLIFLGQYLGPNILKARVELYDSRLLHIIEDIIHHPLN